MCDWMRDSALVEGFSHSSCHCATDDWKHEMKYCRLWSYWFVKQQSLGWDTQYTNEHNWLFRRVRKLRKANISLSFHPFVRIEQLGYHWTDFHKVWFLRIFFRKSVKQIQVRSKSYKSNGYFTWKVKVTLVQAPRLCTGRTALRVSRGIAVPFYDHDAISGWGVSVTPRPLFTPRKDPVPIVQEAGWAPRPVWTGAKNLAPTGIRSPDRPARSQSLYRLSYPAHTLHERRRKFMIMSCWIPVRMWML